MIIAVASALFPRPETATIFMVDRLVTIASFGSIIEAHLAKNQLAESGIEAFLSDEATVYMAWHLANAIHGIKLLVKEEDADDARELLAADSGAPPTAADAELDAQLDDPEPLTPREENAERAFRGAVIGIWLTPWQLYVSWLLVKVYFSDERLGPAQAWKAYVAAAINFPYLVLLCIYVWWLLGLPVFSAAY